MSTLFEKHTGYDIEHGCTKAEMNKREKEIKEQMQHERDRICEELGLPTGLSEKEFKNQKINLELQHIKDKENKNNKSKDQKLAVKKQSNVEKGLYCHPGQSYVDYRKNPPIKVPQQSTKKKNISKGLVFPEDDCSSQEKRKSMTFGGKRKSLRRITKKSKKIKSKLKRKTSKR